MKYVRRFMYGFGFLAIIIIALAGVGWGMVKVLNGESWWALLVLITVGFCYAFGLVLEDIIRGRLE